MAKSETDRKSGLITGITGQDGSYLAELLLKKGYEVTGIVRKDNDTVYPNVSHIKDKLRLISADLLDSASIHGAIQATLPTEVYNLASQSYPGMSFKQPIYTAKVTGIGAHRVLEAVRDIVPNAKFFQAGSSEMFGEAKDPFQNEKSVFNPVNPYGAAKLYAHSITRIYRKSFGIFAACGILFNHESPRRPFSLVTQKIAYAAACTKLGIKNSKHLNEEGEPILKNGKVALGNLDARRDWGFAGDYVEAMWLMLQQKTPDDFVIGTGETHSIRELCEEAFNYVGLDWKNHVYTDKRFVRPIETGPLVADPTKAKKILKWSPKTDFKSLVHLMVDAHIVKLK